MTGEIPSELGSLTNLVQLRLNDNQLTGEIPAELGRLANLERLWLHSNQLTGEIPSELGSLTNLVQLRLNDNQLTGEIPSELGRLTNLAVLHLSGNQLTGCVPAIWRDVEDNDFEELGLSFCDPLSDLITRYDANGNGVIDRSEYVAFVLDYLRGTQNISRDVYVHFVISLPPRLIGGDVLSRQDEEDQRRSPGRGRGYSRRSWRAMVWRWTSEVPS